jgi:predicted Zn-dependent peptidase
MADVPSDKEFVAAFSRIKAAIREGRKPSKEDEEIVVIRIWDESFWWGVNHYRLQPADAEDLAQVVTIEQLRHIRNCSLNI